MQHKKSSEIIRENLTYMLNQEGTPSMRNLSTSIGTSDSYIQKILNQERTPSLDKIDSISEFFDVESGKCFITSAKTGRKCWPSCSSLTNFLQHYFLL